jgi:AraC-like DNA-binding protein
MAMEIQSVIRVYQPCPALQNFVSSYTVAYSTGNQTLVRRQPAFPQQYLIFYPNAPQHYSSDGNSFQQLSKALLIAFTKPVYLTISPLQLSIIVFLHPGALHRLSHLPLHEILNLPLDGTDGFGSEMKRVNEQLSEAKTQEQMIRLIEVFLLKKVQKVREMLPVDHTFRLLLTAPNQYSIDQVARISCVSLRQLERQFLERIGTSPTMFIRQARFTKALRLKRAHPGLNWTAIAYDCGYFDQMHLIRDFKLFTDATPTAFKNYLPAPVVTTA